jgi:hypothetical protein
MKRVPINEIESEHILAEPVKARNGQVLLPQGVALSDRQIKILKTWGIRSVMIETADEEEETQKLSEELLNRGRERIRSRMVAPPAHAMAEQLFKVAVVRAAELCREEDRNARRG